MLTVGPRLTWAPFPATSAPTTEPYCPSSPVSQLAAAAAGAAAPPSTIRAAATGPAAQAHHVARIGTSRRTLTTLSYVFYQRIGSDRYGNPFPNPGRRWAAGCR